MAEIEKNAMFKLSYGLFVLTAVEFGKDNGCIINTVMQITDDPKRIAVGVNKSNRTHEMIDATGSFNVSVLTEDTPFEVFERFGFQSGRDADKFAGLPVVRAENWVRYLPEHTNAVISGEVIQKVDCGTHTLFIADVTEAKVLSDAPSVTYDYYFKHIKPKPAAAPAENGKKKWVCQICGYVHEQEGDELPADFVCPLCKHGADDFELME